MAEAGLFTRQDAREASRKRSRSGQGRSLERVRQLGPKAVRNMNRDARTPEMPPDGPRDAPLYVLGEAPGKEEDERGRPFVGKSGRYLRRLIDEAHPTAYDNVVRTRPPKNRDPKPVEVEAFRRVVEESIEDAAPRVVLGLGKFPLGWMTDHWKIVAARGRRFPVGVGDHVCWFAPTVHPAFVLRLASDGGRRRFEDVPGHEWQRFFERDVDQAVLGVDDWPEPEVLPSDEESLFGGVELVRSRRQLTEALDAAEQMQTLAVDLETNCLRPYAPDAAILTYAFSDHDRTYVVPVGHDESPLRSEDALDGLRTILTLGKPVVAHNLSFEMEWFLRVLGLDVVDGSEWHDTMQAAYALDSRDGGLSLDFLCTLEFGLQLKKLTEAARWRGSLREMRLDKLMRYNALDAKYTALLHERLQGRLPDELRWTYESQVGRVLPAVRAQLVGVPVDQEVNRQLADELRTELDQIAARAHELPEVKRYEELKGRFNVASQQQVGYVLHSMLGYEQVGRESADGRVSYRTAENVLRDVDHPLAEIVLEYRSLQKQYGTYVAQFELGAEDGFVWPDGRIHCQYKLCFTQTGRTSSEAPNSQNWPKRKYKRVRAQLRAPDGWKFVAIDQGQIEARVIAMLSRDPEWVRMLWEDYDVHLEWAERAAQLHPPALERRGGDIKRLRTAIKNELVFPAFFGAQERKIAGYMDIPLGVAEQLFEEFWDVFRGVREWQRQQLQFYDAEGYVECLTGRRRYGPLSYNMVVNTPVQGTASDITVAAWEAIELASRERGPTYTPILNVHDDLTWLCRDEEVDDLIEFGVGEMLTWEEDWDEWINVPLQVEVEVGQDLYSMEEVGKYRSDRV